MPGSAPCFRVPPSSGLSGGANAPVPVTRGRYPTCPLGPVPYGHVVRNRAYPGWKCPVLHHDSVFRVSKAPFPRTKTTPSAQRIGLCVPKATSPACHAASAHAPHFVTHRNSNPGTHRNANPGGYRNANPGTHRNAGPRVPPAKQQVDESAEGPPHFGTHPNANPGTHRNAGGPDVSQSSRLVGGARSLCQPIRRISHNVPCSI